MVQLLAFRITADGGLAGARQARQHRESGGSGTRHRQPLGRNRSTTAVIAATAELGWAFGICLVSWHALACRCFRATHRFWLIGITGAGVSVFAVACIRLACYD